MVWTEYYPVTVLVNRPVDIRNQSQLTLFNTLLDDFENMQLCKGNQQCQGDDASGLAGKQYTAVWLRDYIRYCEENRFEFFFDDDELAVERPEPETGVDFRRLEEFLRVPTYSAYITTMKMIKPK